MKTYILKNPDPFTRYSRQDLDDATPAPTEPWELITEQGLQNWLISMPEITLNTPYRVTKETIISRVKAAGKLTELRLLFQGLSANLQFEFTHRHSYRCDNAALQSLLIQIGCRPGEILAPDSLDDE